MVLFINKFKKDIDFRYIEKVAKEKEYYNVNFHELAHSSVPDP